ncbi:MAG: ATP-binding protein [Gammaproteobacteria bacterium]|nr:ATP-binding protein [Gammaproteobacteria bacterium]MDH5799948.1 ATP-binding protein [Gammaproteobacteria bacterium]
MQFKNPDGSTNWQHVANWSGSILILLLSAAVITLFLTRKKLRKSNLALEQIRGELELRVLERTATLQDTASKLHASESFIKNILESMPLMLVGVNAEGRITQWNRRAETISGLEAASVLEQNLWEAYPSITVSPDQVNEAIKNEETITIKHIQHGQYSYDITIYPLEDHVEPGAVILIDDVTKKMMAENMLIQNDKISSMSELASSMAHDINTPLESILFDLRTFQHLLANSSQYVDEATSTGMPARLTSLLSHANATGEKMASIVKNLHNFARGRSDRIKSANMVDIMEHTLELAGDVLSAATGLKFLDIKIEKDFEKHLPMIPCYVTEFQQALLSLFRHSYDALGRVDDPAHEAAIKIQMIVSYDHFWIRIQHNGVGLSSDEQMYLFEPFVRKDSPDVSYDAGKRLSFAYFIITEQHQGQIAVTSDVTVGTTFHIQLPLKQGAQA